MTQGYDQKGGPLQNKLHNHFIERAFDGFINTLKRAVKINQIGRFDDGCTMYGCFTLPQWFVQRCLDEAKEEAERDNERWDNYPEMRPTLLKV